MNRALRDSVIAEPARGDWASIRRWRRETRDACTRRRLGVGRQRRAALREQVNALLADKLADLAPGTLGLYWPIKGELDLRPLAEAARTLGWQVSLPAVIAPRHPLEFRPWLPGAELAPGTWNIPEPVTSESVRADVLLVPLVGFDAANYRLGYGGGYYDRTLAALTPRPLAIGVGLESCRLETIYPQAHDIPMDQLVIVSA